MNKRILILLALYLCISCCYSPVSFCDEISETKNVVGDVSKQDINEDNVEIIEEPYDEYIINKDVYITDNTMDSFIMETYRLKIKTEDDVVIDADETNYIMTYCVLNHVEYLDLSEATFKDNTFSSEIFMDSKFMKEIVLPDSLEIIGKYSFYEWGTLEKINFPANLKKIDMAAFSGCKSLKEIVLNETLERIEEQAFLGCSSLKVVNIPDSVNFLGRFCFAECTSLMELYLPNNDKVTLDGNILSVKGTIFVVFDGSDAYKQMLPFADYGANYKTVNKVSVKAKVNIENLNKEPKVKVTKSVINRGDNVDITDLVSVDIRGTGAMSSSIKLSTNKLLMEYSKGKHIIDYKIRYYLSDIDISNIIGQITKVEEIEEIINSDDKYFVYAKVYEEDKKLDLEVTDFSSELSKSVNELTGANSYILSAMIHEPFMTGFKDNTFKPTGNLTNEETAVILSKLSKYNSDNKYEVNYVDVNKDSWSSNYIGYVTREDMMTGKNKSFRPKDSITRLEFVVAVCKLMKLKPSDNKSYFPDVWGKADEGYVAALEEKGVISGFKNGSFGPNKFITRAEAVKILVCLLDRVPNKGKICKEITSEMQFTDVNENSWYYIYVLEATTKHYSYMLH